MQRQTRGKNPRSKAAQQERTPQKMKKQQGTEDKSNALLHRDATDRLFGPGSFAMRSWPLLLPTFTLLFYGPGGFACATRGGVVMSSWLLLLPTFSLSFFLSLFFSLWTHFGESPQVENLFPPIYWHNQKIYVSFFSVFCHFGETPVCENQFS